MRRFCKRIISPLFPLRHINTALYKDILLFYITVFFFIQYILFFTTLKKIQTPQKFVYEGVVQMYQIWRLGASFTMGMSIRKSGGEIFRLILKRKINIIYMYKTDIGVILIIHGRTDYFIWGDFIKGRVNYLLMGVYILAAPCLKRFIQAVYICMRLSRAGFSKLSRRQTADFLFILLNFSCTFFSFYDDRLLAEHSKKQIPQVD